MSEERSSSRRSKPIPQYPGPTRSEVFALSHEQVLNALERLKVEPHKLPYEDADDDLFVLAYGQKALDDESAYTEAEIKELRRSVLLWHKECLKGQLFSSYVHEWIASLSDAVLWHIVEDHEQEHVPLSERRHYTREKLRERTGWAVYAQLLRREPDPQTVTAQPETRQQPNSKPREAQMDAK